tara:strand:+ start:557 stop:952 length:396 start_codon:yes stop_codon:yes gene_type:complete
MPTKKKRVGFIPREDVLKIIDELSIENNLSNSKIISILVEEALSIRGILKKNGKGNKSFIKIKDDSQNKSDDSAYSKNNEKLNIKTNTENKKNPCNTTLLKHKNKDDLDFQNYKKFLSFLEFQKMMDEYNR